MLSQSMLWTGRRMCSSKIVPALLEGLALGEADDVAPDVKRVIKQGLANSSVLQFWHEPDPRWKGMLEAKVADSGKATGHKDPSL